MKAVLVLLFSITASDACLKIRYSVPPSCACKALGFDSANLGSYVKSSSQFYQILSTATLKAATFSIDDCSLTMFCPGSSELYVFDTDKEQYIGEYQLEGFCDPFGQTWRVAINDELKSFDKLNGVCLLKPGSEELCFPRDNATYLFMQSTDMLIDDVVYALTEMSERYVEGGYRDKTKFQTVAYVRFDMDHDEEVFYNNQGWEDLTSIFELAKRPTGLNRVDEVTTGLMSDVLKTIERFLDTSPYTVCGSFIHVFLAKYPDDTDIASLVAKLRKYHVFLAIQVPTKYVIISDTETSPRNLNRLAIRTNGFHGLGSIQPLSHVPIPFTSYMVYSQNVIVGQGNGSIILPPLSVPTTANYFIYIGLQEMYERYAFQAISLRWYSSTGPELSNFSTTEQIMKRKSNIGIEREFYSDVVYNFTMDYKYDTQDRVQIRIMSDQPVNYWLPYD